MKFICGVLTTSANVNTHIGPLPNTARWTPGIKPSISLHNYSKRIARHPHRIPLEQRHVTRTLAGWEISFPLPSYYLADDIITVRYHVLLQRSTHPTW